MMCLLIQLPFFLLVSISFLLISHLLITLSYYAIAFILLSLIRQPVDRLFKKFCLALSLILICEGTIQLLEIWTLSSLQDQSLQMINLIKGTGGIYAMIILIRISFRYFSRSSSYNHLFESSQPLITYNPTLYHLENLSYFLQTATTEHEAKRELIQFLQPLFPNTSGIILLIQNSDNTLEKIDSWGQRQINTSPLLVNQCLALQNTKDQCWQFHHNSHASLTTQSCFCCQTWDGYQQPLTLLCLPLVAKQQRLGILQLYFFYPYFLTPSTLTLAKTIVRQIALSLVNLRHYETLEYNSYHDSLTKLFNRRYLEISLERELHRVERENQYLGVIMLDIDYFKTFNDTYGHRAGDKVLQEISIFLIENIRQSDIACRYGGEELIIILPNVICEEILIRAEQIRQGIKSLEITWNQQILPHITVSMGIAFYPQQGNTSEQLLEAADQALFQAKHQGRDCIVCPLSL